MRDEWLAILMAELASSGTDAWERLHGKLDEMAERMRAAPDFVGLGAEEKGEGAAPARA